MSKHYAMGRVWEVEDNISCLRRIAALLTGMNKRAENHLKKLRALAKHGREDITPENIIGDINVYGEPR